MRRACDWCGTLYEVVQAHQKFCQAKCRRAAWQEKKIEEKKREIMRRIEEVVDDALR